MDYNYHTHTYRCNHASGTDEEDVISAIKNGIKWLGFSDHIPFRFPNGSESGYRVPMDKAREYVDSISNLREKYKDVIDIKIGFEMEYYPLFFNQMVENAKGFGAEYLILGQHFLFNEYPTIVGTSAQTDNPELLGAYVSNVLDGIKSGVFSYVAHPDIMNFVGEKEIYLDKMQEICKASKEYNVPLEVNFLGIRGNRHYPNKLFLELMGKVQNPVTFGCDAHTAEDVFDKDSYVIAKSFVKEYNLNYVGKPNIIPILK